jgi:hypothetical protein
MMVDAERNRGQVSFFKAVAEFARQSYIRGAA